MAQVSDVIDVLEQWAPPELAESWDNVGLITGESSRHIDSVLVTLDITEENLSHSHDSHFSMIVSHHPPIFKPLKNIAGNDLQSRIIRAAVKDDIALYSAHTNLDRAPDGVSYALAERLGLENITMLAPGGMEMVKFVTFTPPGYTDEVRDAAGFAGAGIIGAYHFCSFTSRGTGTYMPTGDATPFEGTTGMLSRTDEDRIEMILPEALVPRVVEAARKAHPYDEMAYDIVRLSQHDPRYGYGAVGDLPEPMDVQRFIGHVARKLSVNSLTVSSAERSVRRVAVTGGSGRAYIPHTLKAGADAFVTGEIGHHDFLEHGQSLLLVDATHRATELPVLENIKTRLESSSALQGVRILIDRGKDTHFIQTFPSRDDISSLEIRRNTQ